MKCIIAAVLLGLATITPVTAEETLVCGTEEQFVGAIQRLHAIDPQVKLARLDGPQAASFLEAYNATPPKTNYSASSVVLVDTSGPMFVFLVIDGQFCLVRDGVPGTRAAET